VIRFLKLVFLPIITCSAITLVSGQTLEKLNELPSKFDGLQEVVLVSHFPSPVLASTDPDEAGTYFWKHTTSLLSTSSDIQILEGGAYIYYNDQWNLRVSMDAKEFSKLFDIRKANMKAGQPYTFKDNWRRDANLRGGWAMWYVIGIDQNGQKVFGKGILDTQGKLYE